MRPAMRHVDRVVLRRQRLIVQHDDDRARRNMSESVSSVAATSDASSVACCIAAEHVLDGFDGRELAAEPEAIEQPADAIVQPRHQHRDRQQHHGEQPRPRHAAGHLARATPG